MRDSRDAIAGFGSTSKQIERLEQVADQLPSALSNHNPVRLRHALQARRKVRRLTNDCLLLRNARSDQIANDNQSCCNAYARLERRVGLQTTYSSYQLQPRAHGSLCIVLVGLRITEIHQDPIAQYFATKPPKRCTVCATHFW